MPAGKLDSEFPTPVEPFEHAVANTIRGGALLLLLQFMNRYDRIKEF